MQTLTRCLLPGAAYTILEAEYDVEVNEILSQVIDSCMEEFVRAVARDSVSVYLLARAGRMYLP